mmetsp:Transcript_25607/g.39404  ORF Transcript_25607/g.39404 Transcript_25607/m.39404 type:complete len:144 (+) Transcript_25607:1996-2427(+)
MSTKATHNEKRPANESESDVGRKDSATKYQHTNSSTNNILRDNSRPHGDHDISHVKQSESHRNGGNGGNGGGFRLLSANSNSGAIRSTTSMGIRTNAFEVKNYPSKVVDSSFKPTSGAAQTTVTGPSTSTVPPAGALKPRLIK